MKMKTYKWVARQSASGNYQAFVNGEQDEGRALVSHHNEKALEENICKYIEEIMKIKTPYKVEVTYYRPTNISIIERYSKR